MSVQHHLSGPNGLAFAAAGKLPPPLLPHLDTATRQRITSICAWLHLWPLALAASLMVGLGASDQGRFNPSHRPGYFVEDTSHAAQPSTAVDVNLGGEGLDPVGLAPESDPTLVVGGFGEDVFASVGGVVTVVATA